VAISGAVVASCSSGSPNASKPPHHHSSDTMVTAAPTTTTTAPAPTCPLTGTPAAGGAIPQRPALAVKVDNYPTARPQAGLTKADIVFEEPVEGGITRLVAVFQCQTATLVGPVRSARNIDIGILGQLGAPLLVHVGGIDPVIANIQASPIIDMELGNLLTAIKRVTGRVAPYSTFTSTQAIWKLKSTDTTPPPALFGYSTAAPSGGTPVNSVSIPFSGYSMVVWKYNAADHDYLRFYGTTTNDLLNGSQVSSTNIVVQFVKTYLGPWVENTLGALEVQANLYTHASGTAIVFRDGVEVDAKWSRTSLAQATKFTTTAGAPITLAPGTTWVELVPVTRPVTTTPATTTTTAG
jgi:Protein of unknown function (DUF3048) N-terminal domain/Protein of unknown function (DUF3048) C-terminal domain